MYTREFGVTLPSGRVWQNPCTTYFSISVLLIMLIDISDSVNKIMNTKLNLSILYYLIQKFQVINLPQLTALKLATLKKNLREIVCYLVNEVPPLPPSLSLGHWFLIHETNSHLFQVDLSARHQYVRLKRLSSFFFFFFLPIYHLTDAISATRGVFVIKGGTLRLTWWGHTIT